MHRVDSAELSLLWGAVPYSRPIVSRRGRLSLNDSLSRIARAYGTDKAFPHQFTPLYDSVLGPARQDVRRLLEVGVLGGSSLRMWRDYMPNAEIVGLDHFWCVGAQRSRRGVVRRAYCTPVESRGRAAALATEAFLTAANNGTVGPRITLASADQANATAMEAFVDSQRPLQPFDVIIEDGSHRAFDQQTSLWRLLPLVRPGGIYVIEDIHSGLEGVYGEDDEPRFGNYTTYEVVKRLNVTGRLSGRPAMWPDAAVAYVESWVESAETVTTNRYMHDATCIVRKRRVPRARLNG